MATKTSHLVRPLVALVALVAAMAALLIAYGASPAQAAGELFDHLGHHHLHLRLDRRRGHLRGASTG